MTRTRPPEPSDPEQAIAKCGVVHLTRYGGVACKGHSKRSGKCCEKPPTPGHHVCPDHGSRTPQAKAAAARRLALGEALAELDRLGRPIEVEPAEAMLAMVYEAAGNVAFLRMKVQELAQRVDSLAVDGDGDTVGLAPGIAGRVDPENWKAAPHVLVVMYDEERERLVKWSKMCRDAGVDEKRVRLEEERGALLVDAARGILGDVAALIGVDVLGLPQLGDIIRRHAMAARAIETGAVG